MCIIGKVSARHTTIKIVTKISCVTQGMSVTIRAKTNIVNVVMLVAWLWYVDTQFDTRILILRSCDPFLSAHVMCLSSRHYTMKAVEFDWSMDTTLIPPVYKGVRLNAIADPFEGQQITTVYNRLAGLKYMDCINNMSIYLERNTEIPFSHHIHIQSNTVKHSVVVL